MGYVMERVFARMTTTCLHHVRQQAIRMDHMIARGNAPRSFGSPMFSMCSTKTPILDPCRVAWPEQGHCGWRYHNAR